MNTHSMDEKYIFVSLEKMGVEVGVKIPSENMFRTFEDGDVNIFRTFEDVNIFNTFVDNDENVNVFNTFEDESFENNIITCEDCYISVDENGEYVVDGEVDVF